MQSTGSTKGQEERLNEGCGTAWGGRLLCKQDTARFDAATVHHINGDMAERLIALGCKPNSPKGLAVVRIHLAPPDNRRVAQR